MGLTSLSVLLAVVLLNVHLYGSALKPVPRRLRCILFFHIAPFLRVKLHRATTVNDQKHRQRTSTTAPRRSTTIYNAVFLNENDLSMNLQQPSSHTLHSTTMTNNNLAEMNSNSDIRNDLSAPTISNIQSTPQSLQECKRLLSELNHLILRPSETREEDIIIRDWQNVALVIDRCLFYTYLLLTAILTALTLLIAPLLKTVPTPPEYFRLNVTRE
jgi:nicotinic acetylcholine receptor